MDYPYVSAVIQNFIMVAESSAVLFVPMMTADVSERVRGQTVEDDDDGGSSMLNIGRHLEGTR